MVKYLVSILATNQTLISLFPVFIHQALTTFCLLAIGLTFGEPEATSEAEAATTKHGFYGIGYGHHGLYNPGHIAYGGHGYGGYGLSYGHNHYSYPYYGGYTGHYHYGKRSAEADATAEADPEADPHYFYYNYGNNHGHSFGHVSPSYSYGLGYGYGYPYYGGYSGHYHYGKRSADAIAEPEAEAEADPHFPLFNYGLLAGYRPHSSLIYRPTSVYRPTTTTYHPYALATSYYGHHHLGKRAAIAEATPEADAEATPEAEADPHFYNYFNYGYNHGFNGYSNGYNGYNYGYNSYRPYLYGGYHGHYYG